MSIGIVYRHFNIKTGKSYIGQTWQTIQSRWRKQSCDQKSRKLYASIQKHGKESFEGSLLTNIHCVIANCKHVKKFPCPAQLELNQAEIYWISYFDSMNDGYNIHAGGRGGKHTAESIELIRKNNVGKHSGKLTIEQRERFLIAARDPVNKEKRRKSWLGKKLGPQSLLKKQKTSDALKRYWASK